MEYSFDTRAEADQYVAEHHPGAETMEVLTDALSHLVLLDRDQEIVARVYDWSDDKEAPVVNIVTTPAGEFIRDYDLVDQLSVLLEEAEPDRIRAVLTELTVIVRAGLPPVWKTDSVKGLLATIETLKAELESALALASALGDHVARALWTEQAAAGATLAEVAGRLYLDPEKLASMIMSDRRRTLDL
ncbi:hypothetical protein [Glycomyces terrestris]|uniref:Uncharacterized protein n=1 Tax=Glycomyces terrestris TaxID=2493553 RepID=A0A426V0N8_9ACTN|nr:hypothetical protein [Glycomyces terrestris]RRS00424.1 hypothetical protein EIW28_07605 [Glycomyces terrestris]